MTAREANADLLAEIAALRHRVVSLTRENTDLQGALAQASQREAATSEILQVISGSLTDVQPVFDTIARSAATLCEADAGGVFRRLGDRVDRVARAVLSERTVDALTPDPWLQGPVMLGQTSIGQVIMTGRLLNVPDTEDHPDQRLRDAARANGFRSLLTVPMLRDGEAIGAISVTRRTPGSFSDSHSQLLQTFADQAVIAIENVRLFTELQARNKDLTEALDQQTATSEILRVISSSPTDIQPVFDMLARSARQLCNGEYCVVESFDGERLHFGASDGLSPDGLAAFQQALPRLVSEDNAAGRAVLRRTVVQIPDVHEDAAHGVKDVALAANYRSVVAAPMLRDRQPIGAIVVARSSVGFFPDRQVELIKIFANQAVIAIENVRLFKELEARNRDLTVALDQQTATAEVLKVISNSPTEMRPVFQAIVDSAVRLCDAAFGGLIRWDGDLMTIGAISSQTRPEERGAFEEIYPLPVTPRSRLVGLAIREKRVVQIDDVQAEPDVLSTAQNRRLVQAQGYRTFLAVPLLRGDACFGAISLWRRVVAPFSEQHIALLQTFAEQAVIAIENVRLFNELQEKNQALTQAHAHVTEALEQQTATADILRVISSSPTEVQPVFDALAESASRLCEAFDSAIWRREADRLLLVAHHGAIPQTGSESFLPLVRGTVAGRSVLDGRTVHIADIQTEADEFPETSKNARRQGWRSILSVPLMREGVALGAIVLRRTEAQLFTERQVALLQTFADQAVIAIENVRLFNETKEALEQQTATAEILKVISQSPTDVQPVFETIADSVMRLCGAWSVAVYRFDGELVHITAARGGVPDSANYLRALFPMRPTPDAPSIVVRAIFERAIVHVPDSELADQPGPREAGRARGFRAAIGVPMLRGGEPIGAIGVSRVEPGAFSPVQIELLKTFADQAVIAIENVRLFTELQEKNRALTDAHATVTESLERQTATSEILRVISSSPTNLDPVLDAVARNAARLCEADDVAILRAEDVGHTLLFSLGPDAVLRGQRYTERGTVTARAIRECRTVHVSDVLTDPEYDARQRAAGYNWRTALAVPLIREGTAIGTITARRSEVRPFTETQVALLRTFADQAVIAIENVRLFTELQEKNEALTQAHAQVSEALEQQTATSEVLKIISRSTFDLQPVLDALIENATKLCGATQGNIYRFDGEVFRVEAFYGTSTEFREFWQRGVFRPGRGSVVGRVALEQRTVQILDALADKFQEASEAHRIAGVRTIVGIPMLREGKLIGAIALWRTEVRAFTDKQIDLLQTFADQAVIASENVRLFNELQDRTHQLTRSVEQLTALGEVGRAVSSTLDLETVLSTIVSRAVQLSGLDGGVMFEYDASAEEFVQRAMTETDEALAEARRATRIRKGEGVLGRTAITLEPVQVTDITVPGAYEGRLREILIDSGVRAILAVPMVREGQLIGCLGVTRNQPGEFAAETIELLRTFATQSALAIQNARLFREIEQKSRELEASSRHKSEFLANMSHELRTPLNAVIGFSEVLSERMFGDLNEKQDEYLKDIHASGQHLLSLINDILDLSKIEAGRMELEMTDFELPMAIDNALTLVRERATRRSIALHTTVDARLGHVQGDERKIRQVLLNLLSNAIKFTPEGGRIDVGAKPVDGSIEVSVTDTGVGIAPEDQEAVFEEFKQVGTADKKVEGTGLGLALSRRFVELHGGKIWVKSQVGVGSKFTFTLPMRR